MKKLALITTLGGLLSLGAASALAVPYSDTDLLNITLNSGEWIHSTFDIAAGDGDAGDVAGFGYGSGWVVGAVAKFNFLDSNLSAHEIAIDLFQYPFPLHSDLVDLEFVVNDVLTVRTLMDEDGTGVAGYSVVNTGSSPFTLQSASLTIQAVPDGASTVSLLGLGLIAVALVKRRSRWARTA